MKDQMGHSSIQVTVDVYGHLVPGGNRAAVDRLDDVQPSATPAQPEAAAASPDDRVSRFRSSGEPGRNRTVNPQIKRPIVPGKNTKELSNSANHFCRTRQRVACDGTQTAPILRIAGAIAAS